MSRRRLLLVVVGAILAADIAGALVYYQATRRTLQANRFAVSTRPAGTIPADAALVFCEGVGDRHGLSRTTALRLEFAAGLLRAKQVRHVAGIGGNWGETRGGRGMRAILREASVPAPNAHGEPHSYDTLTNADAFWKMLNERNWRDVVVVSSPIHLHRILYLLRHHDQSRATATRIRVLPYSPHRGTIRILDHWREIHHEWIAWTMLHALPRAWFRAIMRAKRK